MNMTSPRNFRPALHFTPRQGWINDPNGLLFDGETWHLFAQHFPDDTVWGPMHWLHAVSQDLVHWRELDIAIAPDPLLGMAYSGSAVLDRGNASGLGRETDPMICMFTHHGDWEQQSIAFSTDRTHFSQYANNPVIANHTRKDFRDPKLFRNEQKNCWSVVLAAGDHVEFFRSDDLLHWEKTGCFGCQENRMGGVFECPDLFPLTAPDGRTIWVLLASMTLPRELGGARTQYFLGDFDGDTFVQTIPSALPMLLDAGFDNYAAVSFSGAPEPILLGWAASWTYAHLLPTASHEGYRGQMTSARRVSLANTSGGLRLAFHPIVPAFARVACAQAPSSAWAKVPLPGEVFRLRIAAEQSFAAALSNEQGEIFRFGLDAAGRFFTDRSAASSSCFSSDFSRGDMAVTKTPRTASGPIHLDLYFDHSIVEIFADDGTYANTTLVFPDHPYTQASVFSDAQITMEALADNR